MKTPIEMIKEEFCTRYGLNPEQINIDIRLLGVTKEIAEQIGKDYGNKYKTSENSYFSTKCGHIYNNDFMIYTHFPDEEGDELVIEF